MPSSGRFRVFFETLYREGQMGLPWTPPKHSGSGMCKFTPKHLSHVSSCYGSAVFQVVGLVNMVRDLFSCSNLLMCTMILANLASYPL